MTNRAGQSDGVEEVTRLLASPTILPRSKLVELVTECVSYCRGYIMVALTLVPGRMNVSLSTTKVFIANFRKVKPPKA